MTKLIQLLRAKQNYLTRYSYADLAVTYGQILRETETERKLKQDATSGSGHLIKFKEKE